MINQVSDEFELTEEQRAELLPSGKQTIIKNRIGWAITYLNKAGLLKSPKRAHIQITELGQSLKFIFMADLSPKIPLKNIRMVSHYLRLTALKREEVYLYMVLCGIRKI